MDLVNKWVGGRARELSSTTATSSGSCAWHVNRSACVLESLPIVIVANPPMTLAEHHVPCLRDAVMTLNYSVTPESGPAVRSDTHLKSNRIRKYPRPISIVATWVHKGHRIAR